MHLTSNPVDWYAARAAGIVAYLLLTAVVVAGVGLAGKVRVQGLQRPSMVEVHRFGGLLVGTFVALHVATIAIDAFLPFSLAQLAVPFLASYRPLWTALGIVAAELLVALAISNRLRRRLPYRVWRRLHYLNFAVWIGATLHGIGAGTDSRAPWAVAMYAIAVGAVVTVCAVRFSPRPQRLAWPAGLALGAVGALVLGAAVLAIAPSIKHHKTAPAGRGFDDTLTGRVSRRDGTVEELVSLAGRGTGGTPVLVRADLLLSAVGAQLTSLQLEYLPGGQTCTGRVTQAASFSFDGVCRLPDGSPRTVHAEWAGVGNSNTLKGTITARV